MKLKKIKIYNYRSFGEEKIIEFNELTTFIGNNSSGKTTALSALQKLFGTTATERNLTRSDFHLDKDENPEDIQEKNLYIEAVFEFPELEKVVNCNAIPIMFQQLTIDDEGKAPYLRIRLDATWSKGATIEGSIDTKICYIKQSENEEIISDSNRTIVKNKELQRINLIYVPASRNPASQLKNASNSILYRVLANINWTDAVKAGIATKSDEFEREFDKENGVSLIKDAIRNEWTNYHSDSRYSKADLKFNSPDMETILKKVDIEFAPSITGRPYNVDELGDGLKSLFYISLVNSLLSLEEKITEENNNDELSHKSFKLVPPICTILALEEPENHVSPQLLGKVINNIKNISKQNNCQAVISSHSPSIVSRICPDDIRYFRIDKSNLNTEVRDLDLPSAEKYSEEIYKYIKNGVTAYPELYFANLVILGEGDSEEIILPKMIEIGDKQIDSKSISVVPLGGRHVNHFWRLLNQLNIPYITLLDLDRERYLGGWGRVKYVCDELIKIDRITKEQLEQSNEINMLGSFDEMKDWDVENVNDMNKWIKFLQNYDIYFSAPLDIDFLMINGFKEEYLKILNDSEGPYIQKLGRIKDLEDEDKKCEEYIKRLENDIKDTLKEKATPGNTFTEEEKELMIWYKYFFLTRGKPTTHRVALLNIDDEMLIKNMPDVFVEIKKNIESKLC
ncbi:ATP-dependent nuclease [Clostridium tertium]|uniref:ATP-dependent nuclease n=1 Tax=Clostridium tertium TaxID=1559 RepID=UPI000DCFAFDD|nr:AAA family ATPase [Clostridium tertium]